MPGAVRLAAESALRVGAGLVTVVTRPAHVAAVVAGRPELLCYGMDLPFEGLTELLTNATVVVLGSGLGQSIWSEHLFEQVISAEVPMVVDADALNWLAREPRQCSSWVLTPHPGEAGRLLECSTMDIQQNRTQAINALQQRYGGVVVLKGAGTLLLSHDASLMRCDAGNPAMASAGMGDLLSGMIAGFMGQGLTPWEAAQAGVLVHAVAGDRAVAKRGSRGLLASDLLSEFVI
jgi:NAD(P)H-hydrate epimerase